MPVSRLIALTIGAVLASSCAAEAVFIGDADAGRGTPTEETGLDGGITSDSGRVPADATPAVPDVDASDATSDPDDDAADGDPQDADVSAADADACFLDCDSVGARACDDVGRVILCGDSDGDGCFAWESPRACAAGSVCRGGECVEDAACDDECDVRGDSICVTDEATAECGDFDDDPCLELGGPVACGVGEACAAGVCGATCDDVCAPGETRCDGEGNVLTCGNHDDDPCREFGAAVACAASETCTDGACVNVPESCLLIGEYLEGASFDKAVELVNCGGSPRDLRTVGLCLYSNDDSSACSFSQLLTGSLAAGDTLVLCNGRTSIVACDVSSAPVNFNGDDRLVLYEERGGGAGYQAGTDAVLDAFGQSTVRPDGTPWADVTLRRCNASPYDGRSPFIVTDWFTTHGVGDVSDLGNPPRLTGCP